MTAMIPLVGFDNRGHVVMQNGKILRVVNDDYQQDALKVYQLFCERRLTEFGVVPTKLINHNSYMFEHDTYLITYPAEWPSEMLRDAAIFHLELMIKLHDEDLTLKDAIPNNVLFDNTTPKFVDFLSIIPRDKLDREKWLLEAQNCNEDLDKTVIKEMFSRWFLSPLIAMAFGSSHYAREILRHQACNMTGDRPNLSNLLANIKLKHTVECAFFLLKYRAAVSYEICDTYKKLIDLIKSIKLPSSGGYQSYYTAKGEDFSLHDDALWLPKQRSVASFLDVIAPESILDIGSNTGWFSRLAASRGAKVLSLDVDEASLNSLYLQARSDDLAITPLFVSFGQLTETVGRCGEVGEYPTYFSSPLERFKVDLTLMLGLIHHLALGEGRSLSSILETISQTCRKGAIVEFIDLNDPLIANNRRYFPEIEDWTLENYNLALVLETAQKYFSRVSTAPSHPDTRTMLFLEK